MCANVSHENFHYANYCITMSHGTLYANFRIRTLLPAALVEHYKLDVKVAEPPANYKEKFPLGKVPAFVGEKGFKLTETIAINIYRKYRI